MRVRVRVRAGVKAGLGLELLRRALLLVPYLAAPSTVPTATRGTSLVSTVTCTEAAAAASPVEAALLVLTLHVTRYDVPLATDALKKLGGRVSTSPDAEVVEPVRGVDVKGFSPTLPTWLG